MMKKTPIAVARVLKTVQQQKASYTTQRMIENAFGVGAQGQDHAIHPYTDLDMSQFSQRSKPSAAFEQASRKGAELDAELKDLTDGNIVRRTLYNKLTAEDFKDVDIKNPMVLAEWANRFARDGPKEYVYERTLLNTEPVTVTVTGGAGQIAYSLLPRIASGEMFGPNQPVIIKVLDVPAAEKALNGTLMELQDLASPLVTKIIATTDPKEAFTDCDYAILVGAKPRGPGMERGDLLKENAKIFAEQGQAINKYANKDVLVLVVGNPANTNALIVSQFARDIPRQNFSALTRLDHDRGLAMLAKKFDCQTGDIRRFAVWGNHSSTMFPDINHATVKGEWVRRLLGPKADEWIAKDFIPTVAKRGAAIIDARGKSSAASAADAVVKHMYDWVLGNPDWTSMAIYSEGTYGLPQGYFISMPVVCLGMGEVGVVEGLPVTVESARRINASCAELIQEKAAVEALLPNPEYRFYTLDKSKIYSPRSFLENAEERVAKFENLAKESFKSLSTAV